MKTHQENRGLLSARRGFQKLALLGVAITAAATLSTEGAEVFVSPEIVYHYSAGRGEGLSVSSNGQEIMVSSPIDVSLPPATETNYSSFIPFIRNLPRSNNPFTEHHTLALGAIEATDVAVLPHANYGLVAVRQDTTSTFNALLAIDGDQVLQTLPITGSPDGMKVSPDGRYAVVAVEKGGDILVYDLTNGAGNIYLAAKITRARLETFYPAGGLNPKGAKVEPEAVGFAKDSSFALVTIQDSSSIAAVDMTVVTMSQELGTLTPEQIGDLALKNVVHLPHGFKNSAGAIRGVECDGVAVSPDGTFAIVANETHQTAKHLQGLSVLDLRGGLEAITARTYSIFDIDPTLLNNTGLTAVPVVNPGDPYPVAANKLPRLDPANVEIVKRNNQTICAFVIERYNASATQLAASSTNESRGSVLFMEVSDALNGNFQVIERVPIGVEGSTLEGVDSAQNGRWIFVSISNGGGDKGTVARLELKNR
jgi:DNA-binding beta-propeller fold protein YncE